jgi:hypothetical protein
MGSGEIIMTKFIALIAASLFLPTMANAQFKKEDALYQFVCGGPSAPACVAKCLGPGGLLEVSYRDKLIVFQIKEHPRRIWLNADGLRTLVGDDYSCQFPSVPAVPTDGSAATVPNTNLTVPQRQKTCVGNTCF